MMALADIIQVGLDNPECSFFVGSLLGQWSAIQNLLMLGLVFAVFKFVDRLAFEPLAAWIKKKWRGR